MDKINRKFNPEKIKDFQTWDELSQELYSATELENMKKKALERSRIRNELSNNVSSIVVQYMAENHIGFNELVRRLDMSTATVSKIIKGNANITLDTITEISLLTGKHLHITVS
jgi:hypothetical protein